MHFITLTTAVLVASSSALPGPDLKWKQSLSPRGFNGFGIASLIDAVWDYLKPNNAYVCHFILVCIDLIPTEAKRIPFVIQIDGWGKVLPDWNVCYLNGRQFFTDSHIGDFSIEFTQVGGINGNTEDGLHHPQLRLANINNWDVIDVQTISDGALGNDGGGSPCTWVEGAQSGTVLGWQCGVPFTGDDNGFGLDSNTILHTTGYKPGWCTYHVQQYKHNENGFGNTYGFTVIIYVADKAPIGQISKQAVPDDGSNTLNMDSNLPYVLEIHAPGPDDAAVTFNYGADAWSSDDSSHCTLGAYDSGSRNGDCGFTCN
ncbi:MAG: hypothetical protein HETSPECPRED_002700 [Heterodermia speciosa]|uniref:Uncharacterized protein n=1 Tax=Heterodermia speciosa TaxID=116794 RepID=A0A8H3IHL8_9LECA|nr:MAG: hypothetical protein HETSPECPRED_002700 [Heterodermia speciosa]